MASLALVNEDLLISLLLPNYFDQQRHVDARQPRHYIVCTRESVSEVAEYRIQRNKPGTTVLPKLSSSMIPKHYVYLEPVLH